MDESQSLCEILHHRATSATDADRVFVTVWSAAKGVERTLTFAEYGNAVASGAKALAAAAVAKGDRVAFLSKGTLDFWIALLSVQALGATPVLLNWRQSMENLVGMVNDAKATSLLVAAPYHDTGRSLVQILSGEELTLAFADLPSSHTLPF